jgi:hypothetical protein
MGRNAVKVIIQTIATQERQESCADEQDNDREPDMGEVARGLGGRSGRGNPGEVSISSGRRKEGFVLMPVTGAVVTAANLRERSIMMVKTSVMVGNG